MNLKPTPTHSSNTNWEMFFLFTIVGMRSDITNHWGINLGPTVSVKNNVGRAAIYRLAAKKLPAASVCPRV